MITKNRKMKRKYNPFHNRFTFKTGRSKAMKSCHAYNQNMKTILHTGTNLVLP